MRRSERSIGPQKIDVCTLLVGLAFAQQMQAHKLTANSLEPFQYPHNLYSIDSVCASFIDIYLYTPYNINRILHFNWRGSFL